MPLVGYWASQEQYSMHNLLEFITEAEKGDFHLLLQVTIFIRGGMTTDLVISHGPG